MRVSSASSWSDRREASSRTASATARRAG
jgi:hypothetical protein